MIKLASHLAPLAVGALAVTGLNAQAFQEAFDDQATADVTILQEPDTTVSFVDYSNMTVGSTTFSIPEAPRPIAGGLPTRGVLVTCNSTGIAQAVNILAGTTPIVFSGRYRVSFDAWINVASPPPFGGTEQLLFGGGVDGVGPLECGSNRGGGTSGIFGWLAGENGYSTEDACLNNGDVEIADLGDLQTGEDVPFNEAFDSNQVGGANGCAALTWCRVDVDFDSTGVSVYFNGVEFFNDITLAPAGFAMMGYEDPFDSLSGAPDQQWCVLDNFRVTTPVGCGTIGTATPQGTTSGADLLFGAAPPSIGSPLALRLRGGPANSIAFLAAGFPAPQTIPLPLGPGCTVNAEITSLDVVVGLPTNDDGAALLVLPLPDSAGLCGISLGWQFITLNLANPTCPFVPTAGLVTTIGS